MTGRRDFIAPKSWEIIIVLSTFSEAHPVLHTPAIWHPSPVAKREGYAVVLFRRRFTVEKPISGASLWVSASQRFTLSLDGDLLARGPSRSDPRHWGCVPVELPFLTPGEHLLSACVTHFGKHAGCGQMGGDGFFLLHVDGELGTQLDTGDAWRCWHDRAYRPIDRHVWGQQPPHHAIGCGDRLDGILEPWGWDSIDFDDQDWPASSIVCDSAWSPWGVMPLGHHLRPDPLPRMRETAQRFARVALAPHALCEAAQRWIRGEGNMMVPAHTQVRIVLDQGELTNAYPVLAVSGGAGASIRMVSAEAPYAKCDLTKGDRDVVVGKRFLGQRDEFYPDGGAMRRFTTLWFRSFRYIELRIRTTDEPLMLESFASVSTGFPQQQQATFEVDCAHDAWYQKIASVTWRTSQLCAHETYFDCPHYEQAQFPGDSRIQAVYHYVVADDDRLARKAIDDFHNSRLAEGITQCRYPTTADQLLPTFSLYWIGMLHDFRVYRGDTSFLQSYLSGAREVMAWFARLRRSDGLLGRVPYAPFIDWAAGFDYGNAPQDADGGSALLTLLFAEACSWMERLEQACSYPESALNWRTLGRSLVGAVMEACWQQERGLLADTPAATSFSLHTQVQAILAGGWPTEQARQVMERALYDDAIIQPGTLYFRYYVMQAIKACGLSEWFFNELRRWERCLDGTGLTTWPESDVNARSDCHAWSVTPGIEFLQTILGVTPDPAVSGFLRLHFTPALGPLTEAKGTVPTPCGPVTVHLLRSSDAYVQAQLHTPVHAWITAQQRWLEPGTHRLTMRDNIQYGERNTGRGAK